TVIVSNGGATVRQTLSRVFSAMAAERAKKGRKLVLTPDWVSVAVQSLSAMDFGKAVARIALFPLAMCIFCAGAYGQPETRSICVAPMPRSSIEIKERCAPGLCGKGKLSLRIDRQPVRSWPTSQSIKITELNATARHRVVIYEDGKAH